VASFCTILNMLHIREPFFSKLRNTYKYLEMKTLQASRMKATLIILTKIFLITPKNMSLRNKSNCQIQHLNVPGEWLIWCRLGYELSVVNITTLEFV